MRAPHDGYCWSCGGYIPAGSQVIVRHGHTIHATCAPGCEDE